MANQNDRNLNKHLKFLNQSTIGHGTYSLHSVFHRNSLNVTVNFQVPYVLLLCFHAKVYAFPEDGLDSVTVMGFHMPVAR